MYNEAKDKWVVQEAYLPSEQRLFSTVVLNDFTIDAKLYIFGGYRVANNKKSSAVWIWNGKKWYAGPSVGSRKSYVSTKDL